MTPLTSVPLVHLIMAVLLTGWLTATSASAASGKHIPPLGQFAQLRVKTPADAWVVINQSYERIGQFLSRGELAPLRDDADLMRDALGWLKKHRLEVFAPARLEAGRSALCIADDIVDSVHFSAHRRQLESARQYFALLKESLHQVELNQGPNKPLRPAKPNSKKRSTKK